MKADCVSRSLTVCLIALLAIGFIRLASVPVFAVEASATRTPAPDWELKDLNGKTVKSSGFHGKVVVLNFWATWCMPCRVEIPHFVELQKQYGNRGLKIVGVSLDEQGPEVVKKFVKQLGVNYPIVIGNEKIAEAYGGIEGIPTTFVIDRRGRIVRGYIGYNDKATFEKEIQALL